MAIVRIKNNMKQKKIAKRREKRKAFFFQFDSFLYAWKNTFFFFPLPFTFSLLRKCMTHVNVKSSLQMCVRALSLVCVCYPHVYFAGEKYKKNFGCYCRTLKILYNTVSTFQDAISVARRTTIFQCIIGLMLFLVSFLQSRFPCPRVLMRVPPTQASSYPHTRCCY